jgi:hypothetical protein
MGLAERAAVATGPEKRPPMRPRIEKKARRFGGELTEKARRFGGGLTEKARRFGGPRERLLWKKSLEVGLPRQ